MFAVQLETDREAGGGESGERTRRADPRITIERDSMIGNRASTRGGGQALGQADGGEGLSTRQVRDSPSAADRSSPKTEQRTLNSAAFRLAFTRSNQLSGGYGHRVTIEATVRCERHASRSPIVSSTRFIGPDRMLFVSYRTFIKIRIYKIQYNIIHITVRLYILYARTRKQRCA